MKEIGFKVLYQPVIYFYRNLCFFYNSHKAKKWSFMLPWLSLLLFS